MKKLFIDAGTTWSKIIEISDEPQRELKNYVVGRSKNKFFYIIPSNKIKQINLKFNAITGHMSLFAKEQGIPYENEVIALSKGLLKTVAIEEPNFLAVDLGSRDIKWVRFKDGKFKDLDWNTSCAGATGATVEMLLKFYDVRPEELNFNEEKYNITCGIYGLEKIMDDIANGEKSKFAIAKFVHGIAFNAWTFAKKPEKLFLSGGFCDNECFVKSLQQYCEVIKLGRFALCEGISSDLLI